MAQTKNQSQRCRVCLDNEGIVPIFGDGNYPDISLDLMAFGTIKVQKHDEFPKLICSECLTLLDGAITFRKTAIRSDTLLKERKMLNNRSTMPVKIELELCPNNNETIATEHYYPAANKKEKENSKIEIKLESIEDFHGNVTDDDGNISWMQIGKERPTTFKDEDVKINPLKLNPQPSGLQPKSNTTNAIKTNCFVISEKTIKTEISHQPPPVVITNKKCEICKKLLSKKKYSIHMRTVHNITISKKTEPKLCLKCNKLFPPQLLPQHMREVHAEDKKPTSNKPYRCETCCMDFTGNMYVRHFREVHNMTTDTPTKTKECPFCKKMFHPNYLGVHIKNIHKGERTLSPKVECPICKKFFSQNYYIGHQRTHEPGNTNYVCDVCGKDFLHQSAFALHKVSHTNELPFKCDHCPYRGRSKNLLKIHSRTHAEEYPYKCDQCDTQCITRSKLNWHMRKKHINTDFICETCNKGFLNKLELERHVSYVHLGIRDHKCDLCGAAFGYKHGLSKHKRKVHKIRQFYGKKSTYLKIQE